MAVFKCKMCGGALEVQNGESVAVCDYCGTKQTLPKTDDGVVANLFNRANNLRLKCEFDKAEAIYEKILEQDNTEAEAHWGIILCKYGIEYVEDPKTFERIPTCHRTSYESTTASAEYLAALEHADSVQREVYEHEAKAIDAIQKNILSIVEHEKPFDVFLCYKETDENGKRTVDSAIANDIYYQLTQEGFKVFYAAITLEDKLGQEYEPYIFAALNSAKVMLAIGTKPEYFEAVWVKNEWSRFMKLMKTDRSKLLIPCYKDMDAYDLPEDFAHLQAQDMGKIGFINDVVRGIKKVIVKEEPKAVARETVATNDAASSVNMVALLKRAYMALEDGEFGRADDFCEQILNMDAENAEAYLVKLCAELKVNKVEKLSDSYFNIESRDNFKKVLRFADDAMKNKVENLLEQRKKRIAEARRKGREKELKQKELFPEKQERSIFRGRQQYISTYKLHTVGLKSNGTVVAVGNNEKGQCNVENWRNIVAVSVGDKHTIGLESDGTVVAVGDNYYGQCDVEYWKNIVAVSAGCKHTVGLKSDGTVVAVGSDDDACDVESWKNIVAVSAGDGYTVGLKSNGTVVATGDEDDDQCDVKGWKNIIAVSAGDIHTVGLKSDGTVVAVGDNEYGQCDVEDWENIVAISTGAQNTVGLKSDGTVVAAGEYIYGQIDVCDWKDIVAISTGGFQTLGLKSNGTVVSDDESGVKSWKNIAVPLDKKEYEEKLEKERNSKKTEQEAVFAAERARKEAIRKAKIESLEKEKATLEAELPNIKGLFSGGKKAKVEARIAEITKELQTLK